MAIKRQKLNRKVVLVLEDNRVVDMPPGWQFTITTPPRIGRTLDFGALCAGGRSEIAAHMRDAIWSLRHEVSGKTLEGYYDKLSPFWRFLDAQAETGIPITRLDEVDATVVESYLAWLNLQSSGSGKTKGQMLGVAAKKKSYDSLKALLVNRQKRNPKAVSARLEFPRNPFPNSNRLIQKRAPYSIDEQKRILAALNTDLAAIHEAAECSLTDLQVLVVHLLVLGLAIGRNTQSLLELRRDSLRPHVLPDREFIVTTKRRGCSTHATSFRKDAAPLDGKETLHTVPSTIGEHFRFLCEFTVPLVDAASPEDRDFVFLRRVNQKQRRGQVVPLANYPVSSAVQDFAERHQLSDDHGRRLTLNVARVRPTMGTELYRRTRDVRRVQQALGHADVATTARHYIDKPIEAERDHALLLDGLVGQFTRMEIGGQVALAADGVLPLADIENLLSGGYNTGIARCRNPFREGDSVCKKFFACFKCPSMCVFEDDLWRLFSFYYRLLAEQPKINPVHWLKTYGPIIRRIDVDIAPQFPNETVVTAREKAQATPHPTWMATKL